jgi:RNA recognition motif-containing protein
MRYPTNNKSSYRNKFSRSNYKNMGCDPTLFLSSISFDLSLSDLYAHFEQFGRVAVIKMVKKRTPNKKSTALMRMMTMSGVKKVIESRKQVILGYDVFVEKKLTGKELVMKNEDTGKRRIYVSNIPGNYLGDDLSRLFSKYGKVEMAYTKVPTAVRQSGNLSKSKIYGFVTFYKMEHSQMLLDMKTVKFDELEEEVVIKPFNKKSTKLTIEYFEKNGKHSSEEGNSSKQPHQTSRNPKQAMFMKSKSQRFHGSASTVMDNLNINMITKKGLSKFDYYSIREIDSNHHEDNIRIKKAAPRLEMRRRQRRAPLQPQQ